MTWIANSEAGSSVRMKLNTIPNDGTNCLALSTGSLGAGVATLLGNASSGTGGPAGTTNPTLTGATINAGSLIFSGNISSAAWTTSGLRTQGASVSLTDTSSSGTVAAAYTNLQAGCTILASSATTYTNYFGTYFTDPVASTNVTFTNKWSLGADKAFFTTLVFGVTAGGTSKLDSSGALQVASGKFLAGGSPGSVAYVTITDVGLGVNVYNGGFYGFSASGTASAASDTVLYRLGAANIRQGLAPSSAPIAQIFTLGEASRGGTDSNVGGANGTLRPGLGTGTGTLAQLLLQGVVIAASGTTAQTYATAISINDTTGTGLQFNGYVAGALTTDASGNITATSARSAKEAFRDFQYGLETVSKIKPQWWKWREETNLDRSREYGGFVADDVIELIPELKGHGDPIHYVLAACVNAIRELDQRSGR
jgi:Chaperone of endosialidase